MLIENRVAQAEDVIDGFLLRSQPEHFEHEHTLSTLKHDLNKGKWDHLNDISAKPILLAQLLLDFFESLSAPILSALDLELLIKTEQKATENIRLLEHNPGESFQLAAQQDLSKPCYQLIA